MREKRIVPLTAPQLAVLSTLLLLLFYIIEASAADIPLSPSCSSNEIFDTTSMQCTACPEGRIPSTSINKCICIEGFFDTIVEGAYTCQKCPSGEAASRDRTRCMPCGSSTSGFDPEIMDCTCAGGNQVLVEKSATNEFLPAKECMSCGIRGIPDSNDRYKCMICPDERMVVDNGQCVCSGGFVKFGNQCLYGPAYNGLASKYPVDSSSFINYRQVYEGSRASSPTTENVKSYLVETNFHPAAVDCQQFLDPVACNRLANLCVLNRYDETSAPCALFKSIMDSLPDNSNGFQGWKAGLPFLYYGEPGAAVLQSGDINITVAYYDTAKDIGRLPYVLSVYRLDGTWLGYQDLTTQLLLCGGNALEESRFLNFGHVFQSECFLNLQKFVSDSGQKEPLFYELYLKKGESLYPIPVQLLEDDWESVYNAHEKNLFRRFFLIDPLSGKPSATDDPAVIQFLEYAELHVKMKSSDMIFPPLLALRYSVRKTSEMTSIAPNLEYAQYESIYSPQVTFRSSYQTSFEAYWITFGVFLIVFSLASFLQALAKTYFFIRRRAVQLIDLKVLIVFFWKVMECGSSATFVVLVGGAMVLLLFFKIPDVVFLLSPSHPNDMIIYYVFVPLAFVGKAVDIICCLYEQCNVDIFFVDWEKSWGKIVGRRGRTEAEYAPISIWRTLFIAKQWSKLQTKRMISLEVTLSILLFILIGYDLELLATEQPDPNVRNPRGTSNPILRFAIVSSFWIGIVIVQYCLKRLYYWFIKDPLMTFIDLCSLSNISIFALSEEFYGYYIHGESVHPHADDNMKQFNLNLEKEAQDTVVGRGLVPEPNARYATQTFQVYIPQEFRIAYNERLLIPIAEANIEMRNQIAIDHRGMDPRVTARQIQRDEEQQQEETEDEEDGKNKAEDEQEEEQHRHKERMADTRPLSPSHSRHQHFQHHEPQGEFTLNPIRLHDLIQLRKRRQPPPERLFDAYRDLNSFLKRRIDEIKIKHDQVCEKMWWHRLGMPPDMTAFPKALFFKDPQRRFTRLLLRGIEFKILEFNILLFAVLDLFMPYISYSSLYVSLFIVYVANVFITQVRRYLGRRNLVKKTLIDERFIM